MNSNAGSGPRACRMREANNSPLIFFEVCARTRDYQFFQNRMCQPRVGDGGSISQIRERKGRCATQCLLNGTRSRF